MVEQRLMSRDLAGAKQRLVNVKDGDYLTMEAFVNKVDDRLEKTRDKQQQQQLRKLTIGTLGPS